MITIFLSPMLLQSSPKPPNDNTELITELKLDGIRLIFSHMGGKKRLYTRHNNEVTWLFPEIAEIDVPENTILDGELVAYNSQGKPDFELMQQRLRTKTPKQRINLQYLVFDILIEGNNRITHKTLIERKQILTTVLPSNKLIQEVKWIKGMSTSYFELVKDQDLEGIVVKDPQSIYSVNQRPKHWLKVINYKYKSVYITGFRKDEFGLTLTDESGASLGFMEHVSKNARAEFHNLKEISQEKGNLVYLKRPLPCKVKFRNYTNNGFLRIPVFMEWL